MLEISYNLSGHSYKKASYIKIVLLFILFVRLIVALFTLFSEPRVSRHKLRDWKETQGAIGTTDRFVLSWLTQQLQQQTHFILSSPGSPNRHNCDTAVNAAAYLRGAHVSLQHTTRDPASTS